MPLQLRIENRPGYLHAYVTGENTPANIRQYLADVRSACAERKCPAVLVEENLQGPGISIARIHQIVTDASEEAWPVVQCIAAVDVNPAHEFKNMKFAETVALNRGVNVRVFRTVDEARSWLLKQIDARSPGGERDA